MTTMSLDPLLVRACIPHFYRGNNEKNGYGSSRPGSELARSLSLSNCISSLLRLQHSGHEALLHIADRAIDHLPPEDGFTNACSLKIEITVYTDGHNELSDVLDFYQGRIRRHVVDVENPRLLPLAARDELILSGRDGNADIYLYLEDDIIIHDKNFLDKQIWFLRRTNHRFALMPHRYEQASRSNVDRLFVDGPLRKEFIKRFAAPQANVASGLYKGVEKVSFDIAANPHSGSFTLSKEQVLALRKQKLPISGFVSPLETAATLTVLKFFPVLKPSIEHRSFLMVEHGHPSFMHYTSQLPHRHFSTQQDQQNS